MNKKVVLVLIGIVMFGIFLIKNDFFYQLSEKDTALTENQMINDIDHILIKKIRVDDIEITTSNGRNESTTVY